MGVVNGVTFLKLPNGTIFRSVNLLTDKPMGRKKIKTGIIKDVCNINVIGYFFSFASNGEESSARMNCPSACKFMIMKKT